MKTILENKWLDLFCRIFVGGIFIYASIYKIHDPCDFAKAINGYKILPGLFINLQAVILSWTEMLCGILIIQGRFARSSALLIMGMMVMFITAISFNLVRGVEFDCGCFAAKEDICDAITARFVSAKGPLFKQMRAACDLIRDVLILAPAVFVLFFNHDKRILIFPFKKKQVING
jgi:uncharacterized membrane protein YphA (DoxX/SURF4 family)